MRKQEEKAMGFDDIDDTIECSKHLRKPIEYFCK